jgi:hypothetical protein
MPFQSLKHCLKAREEAEMEVCFNLMNRLFAMHDERWEVFRRAQERVLEKLQSFKGASRGCYGERSGLRSC